MTPTCGWAPTKAPTRTSGTWTITITELVGNRPDLSQIAGGAVLVAGVFALLLLAPAAVWAARERARPLGLGGLVTGLGVGVAVLIALANARCAASNVSAPNYVSECVPPDLTGFFVAAAALVAIGVVVSLLGVARTVPRSA